jgi:hypothetical protein
VGAPLCRLTVGSESQLVPAVFVDAATLECVLPDALAGITQSANAARSTAFSVGVEVSNEGVVFSGSGLAVDFVLAPVVSSISPTHSLPAGGALITVRGQHFSAASRCAFGVLAPAAASAFVSAEELVCASPAHAAAVTELRITSELDSPSTSLRPQLIHSNGIEFTFVAMTVASVAPVFGPSSGGTDVTVTGMRCHLPSLQFEAQ